MDNARIGSRPFFERGVDSIVDAPPQSLEALLPLADGLAPSSLAHPAALEELLAAHNLDSLLAEWILPELLDRELLAPRRFRAAIAAVREHFAATAQARRKANPRLGTLLDAANEVLGEADELQGLLQDYLLALVRA